METLRQDLRYAVRALARSPRFTALTIVTLALGIGAATSGFSLLNWVLLRPVPGIRNPSRGGFVSFAAHDEHGYQPNAVTPSQRDGMLHRSPAVRGLAGIEGPMSENGAADEGAAKRLSVDFVTSDYFTTVGAAIQLGRGFLTEDDTPLGPRVAVISDRLWHEFFSARPDVLESHVQMNGVPFTVVGVAAARFLGADRFRPTDIWIPGSTYWDVKHFSAKYRPRELGYNRFILRLQDDASFTQAAEQLQSAIRALALADTAHFNPNVSATVLPGLGLEAQYGAKAIIDHELALIMGVAGLVLLVSCANTANLLLFRRARRRADLVVRLVLGAGRGRLIRYAVTEGALIGFASAIVGVLLALWVSGLFHRYRMLRIISMQDLRFDWRVLAFAVIAGILVSTLAGLTPALFSMRSDLASELKTSGPAQAGGAPGLRLGMAVLQVAVSLTLVTGTYLFARTLQRYAQTRLGFEPTGVTIFQVDPKAQGYSPRQQQAYLRTLQSRIAALPDVERVAFVSLPPFFGITNYDMLRRIDVPPDARPQQVASQQVSSDYFAALRIPVLRGAPFRLADLWPDSGRVVGKVILSVRLAKDLFAENDPLGQIVVLPGYHEDRRAEVVGIVGDVHWNDRGGEVEPMLYTPVGQSQMPYGPFIAVRNRVVAGTLEREVQEIGQSLDPSMPITPNGPLSETVATSVSSQTLLFRLVGLLAAVSLTLSMLGVYGLVAYGVTTRIREFGLRMALGAQALDIVRTALRPAMGIMSLGVVGGIVGAVSLTRLIESALYGVSPLDPLAFLTAALLLSVAVLLASWIPARKAAKVDPMVALRYE